MGKLSQTRIKLNSIRRVTVISILCLVIATSMLVSSNQLTPVSPLDHNRQKLGLPAGGPYDYVIIGPSRIEPIVGGLINWKMIRGLKARFISIEDVNISYSGIDLSEKLRNFCSDMSSNWGTKYLLLIGSTQEIPLRYFATPDEHYDDPHLGGWNDSLSPSDQYYAGVTSNWDDDGDLVYGERLDDTPDWAADIYVGRIPLDNDVSIQTAVKRIINYEKAIVTGAVNESLLIGSILRQQASTGVFLGDANGSKYTYDVVRSLFKDINLNVTQLLEWEKGTSPPPPSNLTMLDFKWLIGNRSWSIINFMTNAKIYDVGRSYTDFENGWNSTLNAYQANTYNFSGNPLMVFGYGITAGIDFSYSAPEKKPLVIALMENDNGPIAVIGYSRGAWYTEGNDTANGMAALLNKYFWQNFLNRTDHRAGPAFYRAREVFSHQLSGADEATARKIWKLLASQMFIGDPETPIWWNSTNQVQINISNQLYEDSLVSVHVTNSTGYGLDQALVRIQGEDGAINQAYTNSSGYALVRAPSVTGNYTVYAEHSDYDYAVAEGKVIDNEEPVITDYAFSSNTFFRFNETLTVTANVTDVENTTAGRVSLDVAGITYWLNLTSNPSGQQWSGDIVIPRGGPVGNQSFTIVAYDLMTNHSVSNSTYLYIDTAIPVFDAWFINSTMDEQTWLWSSTGDQGMAAVYKRHAFKGWVNASETDTYIDNLSVWFYLIGDCQSHKYNMSLINGTFYLDLGLNNSWRGVTYQAKLIVFYELAVNYPLFLGNVTVIGTAPEIKQANVASSTVVIPNSIVVEMELYDEDDNIVNVYISALDPEQTWHNNTAIYDGTSYTGYVSTLNRPAGEWQIYIIVVDLDGEQCTLETPLTVNVVNAIDPTPVIIITATVGFAVLLGFILIYSKRKGL
ncbi:MAG: C25 family cysteine peptidase [Candidatus Ranarchaeia archaeon]